MSLFSSLRRDKETEVLQQQINLLKDAIKREQEKAADLEMKSKEEQQC